MGKRLLYRALRLEPGRKEALGRRGWLSATVAALLLAGCSTDHYRKAADRDVYRIINAAEVQIFGEAEAFTIDTAYSGRDPDEVLAGEIIEQRRQEAEYYLTIKDALEMAVRNSREYQTQKEQLYLKALNLTGAEYEFSPRFLGEAAASLVRGSDGETTLSGDGTLGLDKLFKSGLNLSVRLANDFLLYYSGDAQRSIASTLSVNIVQPLLRGAGKSIVAENLKQTERDVIYALRSYAQYQKQFAVDIVLDYFGLLQDADELFNAYDDYKRRLETIRYTEARGEAGKVSQLEADEARTEELTAKNSYIAAAVRYRNNLDGFKITLGLPLTARIRLDKGALKQLEDAGLMALRLDNKRALDIAVNRHLELLNNIDRFDDTKRKVALRADRLRTELNIVASASFDRQEDVDFTEFDPEKIRAGVGLQLKLPFDRLNERNQYRAALIDFESDIRTLGLRLDEKKDQIDRGLRDLEGLRRTYFIQKNSLEIARRRVTGEELSLQAGRRSVINVRDAQDQLVRSQNALTAALVSHLSTKMQLLLDIGVLDTEQGQFWLKADALEVPIEQFQRPETEGTPTEEIRPPDDILSL